MPKNFKQLVAELCDGDKNLPSREAITLETLIKMWEAQNDRNK